jgi:hypothetical protein
MKTLACCWLSITLPVLLTSAPVRVARVAELEGKVEVQLHAADAWRPAVRNLPLVELAWVRTAPGSRVEMELDDGSALRLIGDTLCELSDYTRLSTGQRITILSVDHGVAYYTGEPDRRDAVILVLPGAQATVRVGSRVRLWARDEASEFAVLEGKVRFSSPGAEMDLAEGEMSRVDKAGPSRFFLYREISPLDSDSWNEQRDKALAASGSTRRLPGLHYGLVDLDANGSWIVSNDAGVVWKPKVAPGWIPYRDGQWLWYDEVGYTWVPNEPWGWLPYHYGRWVLESGTGWVWAPAKTTVFKPGEVYWLQEAALIGWGPLAPGESWDARVVPKLYARSNTTLAKWKEHTRELAPTEASEKLKTTEAVFVVAPPSPAMDAARLDAVNRTVLLAGSTRVVPIVPGVTYGSDSGPEMAAVPPVPPLPSEPSADPPPDAAGPPPQIEGPLPEPVEIYYPAPVYTGIVVVNPPEDHPRRPRSSEPSKLPSWPSSPGPTEHPQPPHVHPIEPPAHHPDPAPIHPVEPPVHHPEPPPARPHDEPVKASEPKVQNSDTPSSDKGGKHQ